MMIFDFLKSHRFDVFIQAIANSRTTKISLLCQLAAIFTGIFRAKFTSITNAHFVVTTLQPVNFPRVAYFEMKLQRKYSTLDSI